MLIQRVELWTDLKAAGGTHLANLAPHEILKAELTESTDGDSTFALEFARSSEAWSSIQGRRVIRCIHQDGSVTEHRIVGPAEERGEAGARRAVIRAESPLLSLANGIVSRTEADGTVTLTYTLLSQARGDLVDLILAGAPSWFAKGTVDGATTKVEAFSFDFDTPLSALQELAELEGLELAARRNGDTNYLVDLVEQVGASASVPEFRYRKNILGIRRESDDSELANRIYPAGGGDGVVRLTAGKARWRVNNVPGSTQIELDDDPIYRDDHLVGNYIEKSDETTIEITDSDYANQRLTLASAHGLSVGDYVWLRENTAGKELTYVEDHVSQASYGIWRGVIEEPDLPPVDNLAPNPTFSDWTAGLPDDWSKVSTPTVSENTDELYTQVGGSSAKVVATAAGQGLKSAAFDIDPVDPLKFFSGFVSVYVESGEVEFYWQHSTEGRFPEEGADEAAYTSEIGRFIELAIAGKEFPSGTVELYVVSRGAATFYLDAAQFTNMAANYPFFAGRAANELWTRGLEALDERSIPKVTYSLDALDLTTIDPATFPYDELTLGGDVYVYDEDLDLELTTRVLMLRRDLLGARTLGLELSNRPADLADEMSVRLRRKRLPGGPRPGLARIHTFEASHQVDGTVQAGLIGAGSCRSWRYLASKSAMPAVADVVSSGEVSNTIDGTPITVEDNGSDVVLGPSERVFIRAVAFPLKDGTGTAGETGAKVVGPPSLYIPSITGTTVLQIGDGDDDDAVVRRCYEVNSRTVAVRVFRKKAGWPTKDGTSGGTPDPKFDRGMIDEQDGFCFEDGEYSTNDVIYDVAIPYDMQGRPGAAYTNSGATSYTVQGYGGGGGGDPYLVDVETYLELQSAGSACSPTTSRRKMRIYWGIANATLDSEVDLKVHRRETGASSWDLVKTELSPITNTNYDDTQPAYEDSPGEMIGFQYKVELWNNGQTVLYDSKILTEGPPEFEGERCPAS